MSESDPPHGEHLAEHIHDAAVAIEKEGPHVLGVVLMAGGALFAVLCGLCTAALMVGDFAGLRDRSSRSWDVLVLVMGGIPALVGVGTFVVGLVLFRQRRS